MEGDVYCSNLLVRSRLSFQAARRNMYSVSEIANEVLCLLAAWATADQEYRKLRRASRERTSGDSYNRSWHTMSSQYMHREVGVLCRTWNLVHLYFSIYLYPHSPRFMAQNNVL